MDEVLFYQNMDWFMGAFIFWSLTVVSGLIGSLVEYLRIRAGILYGDEVELSSTKENSDGS
jgi:hypothetical protein